VSRQGPYDARVKVSHTRQYIGNDARRFRLRSAEHAQLRISLKMLAKRSQACCCLIRGYLPKRSSSGPILASSGW